MTHLWQHPYVNVFKHFNIASWKKATKEGEVVTVMDKGLKCTVYRITGSIPAGNYVQLPQTSTQSLGLTGRYLYLLFRPIPSKYFVVHVDVVTHDALVVRISFSNLFKEFKSTSTWLQFPFVCQLAKGGINGGAKISSKDQSGPASLSSRWTLLCLDLQYILSMYLNRKYSYIKNIRLCANMFIKNVFTSDLLYEPGISVDQAKRSGALGHGVYPVPREMSFPLPKGEKWKDHYDIIRFPLDTSSASTPIDSIQHLDRTSPSPVKTGAGKPGVMSPRMVSVKQVPTKHSTLHHVTRTSKVAKKQRESKVDLPQVGIEGELSRLLVEDEEIHVYAHPKKNGGNSSPSQSILKSRCTNNSNDIQIKKISSTAPKKYKTLKPDPILQLKRIVGFGGGSFKEVLWAGNGTVIVYPCNAVLVAMQISNGHQRFFIGHTDKISCLAMNNNTTLVASGQTGQLSVIRVWKFQSAECLAMFKTHSHSLSQLSFSRSGNVLCGVGKDGHGKNMVVVWNTSRVTKGGEVSIMAKAHTEVDINTIQIAEFDDSRMISCGRDNIRLWRVRDGQLRSAPVNLGEHHSMEFTDCCFEAGYMSGRNPADRLVYACSRSGHIFEIDYYKVAIHNVHRLLPSNKNVRRDKQTFNSGSGVAVNRMVVNESFCVTGSDDGYLRLWPLDFKQVYLEAEHEGPVTAVNISPDGLKLVAGTSTGNLGILDTSTRAYTTLMRSHVDRIISMSMDPLRSQMATISRDHTIRVWDMVTMQQLYDFSSPQECPSAVSYHPTQQILACGFENGCVRIFNVTTTSLLAEYKQHRGKVTGVAFSPGGDHLYTAGSLGSMALYDATDAQYKLIRLLANMVARGEKLGPDSIAVSPAGHHIAVIGPNDFIVSVLDGRSLDEVLRIDITSLNTVDNSRTVLDTAMKVCYAPAHVKQLLVTTSNNKLLKFDSRTGRILAEIDHIHRSGCTSIDVSRDGLHLITSGDRVIKVWDYHMKLDLNFQVFIGHSENVSKAIYTPDSLGLVTVGEAIFCWDFLANIREKQITQPEGRTPIKSLLPSAQEEESLIYRSPLRSRLSESLTDMPRRSPPKPARFDYTQLPNFSSGLHGTSDIDTQIETNIPEDQDKDEILIGPDLQDDQLETTDNESVEEITGHESLGHSPQVQPHRRHQTPAKTVPPPHPTSQHTDTIKHSKPTVHKHYSARPKSHRLAQRRYTAPPNQAGLAMKAIIGYNGDGRGNMVWQPDTGFFAYTSGCTVIVEDLNTGDQRYLNGHVEDISTLAIQNDSQVLASSSGGQGSPECCQIFLWDLQHMTCIHVLNYHKYEVVALAFSRDDKYLVSIGDYRDCTVVLWSMYSHSVLATSRVSVPIFDIKWDPYTPCEFTTAGQNGSLQFWLVDESSSMVELQLHEADVPEDLLQTHHMGVGQVDFTALEYASDNILYAATCNGKVSAWDTKHNSCFMHWEAANCEIGVLVCRSGRLLTGTVGRSISLWSTVAVGEMKLPGDHNSMGSTGLTMEDEMNLDGPITCASFDDTMDMGIVGTGAGTLWYVNWTERSSVRLVSSHMSRINDIAFVNDQFIATCSDDGSLRLWSLQDREQTLQFQVMDQACNCMAFSPTPDSRPSTTTISRVPDTTVLAHSATDDTVCLPQVVAGYSDGTLRIFDLNHVEMILKMHPHAVAVTAVKFSVDGRMVLSGGSDGILSISSVTTGMTVRVINDHRGAPINCIDVLDNQNISPTVYQRWLATSADRRVSIWDADWSCDYCELVDWLSFPAPAFTPDGTVIRKGDQSFYSQLPLSLARFSREQDVIVYVGYGMQKQIQFYSISQKKILRTIGLTHWPSHMNLSLSGSLITVGINGRLIKLIDYNEGSFQDYTGHSDNTQLVCFSADSKQLLSVGHSEIIIWNVLV